MLTMRLVCSRVSRYVARYLQPRQKEWNKATENRVAALSSMLSSMKSIKMLGLETYISARVRKLRFAELLAALEVRWMMVYYNASGMSPYFVICAVVSTDMN